MGGLKTSNRVVTSLATQNKSAQDTVLNVNNADLFYLKRILKKCDAAFP
ncbi:hypothetical protein [Shewanella sp. KJ2020]|nr:hypothetical protein [Shewanella sp. KJ2020]MCP3127098.1 hypothetical protein [Shewanella sp. KJ2020]